MSKKTLIILIISLLILISGSITLYFILNKDDVTDSDQVSETNENDNADEIYVREGVIFSNPYYHNLEVLDLGNGTYKMFFSENNVIKSATSTDGVAFELNDGSIMQGGMVAFIKIDDTTWRMYFVQNPGSGIKSATTTDGINFTLEDGYRISAGPTGSLDVGGPIHPSVIRLPNGTYKMYYDGVTTTDPTQSGPGYWAVLSATSEEGLIWEKDQGSRIILSDCSDFFDSGDDDDLDEDDLEEDLEEDIIDEEDSEEYCIDGAWSVHAEYSNEQYVLYFSAGVYPISVGGIWRAVSENGTDFTIECPVLTQDPELEGQIIESEIGGPQGVPQDSFILDVPEGRRLFYWTPDKGLQSAILES